MSKSKVTVLAVDDHSLFRKGMVMLLKSFPEVGETLEAENGMMALDVLKKEPVKIVLLDLEMPVLDGWETAKKITANYPDIKVIMISSHKSMNVISDLIEMGVHSYILKESEPDEVHKAIKSVVNDEFYYNQLVAQALMQKMQIGAHEKPVFNRDVKITTREKEILQLICQELTMKEIGENLFLSEQTVHTHRKNIMRKTKVKNAVGLVKFAISQRIVSI